MARPYTGPRLWLDSKRGTWTICDGQKRIRTGFTKSQKRDALAEIRKYARDETYTPVRRPRPNRPYYAQRMPRNGVYVIGFGVYVKIGFSLNVDERIATLQTAVPEKLELLALLEGWEKEEREFHARFSTYRLRGEWFRREGDLATWIDGGCND